jgi:hypothetical protein
MDEIDHQSLKSTERQKQTHRGDSEHLFISQFENYAWGTDTEGLWYGSKSELKLKAL